MPTDEEGTRKGPRLDQRRIRDGEWWLARTRGQEPGPLVWGIVERMMQQQQWRIDRYRHISRSCQIEQIIMGGRLERQDTIDGVMGTTTSRSGTPITANIIEALQADIYKNRILPMPLTARGNYIQQKRAKDLGCFIEGVMYENGWDLIQLRAGLFALYFGTVFVKCCVNAYGRITLELIPPFEMWYDDLESRYGTPRCGYHIYLCDRSVLYEQYVARAKADDGYANSKTRRARALEDAPAERGLWLSVDNSIETQSDMVAVCEAWHLESGPGAGDGRYLVSVKGVDGTMVDDLFECQEMPVRCLTTQTPLAGVFGDSLAWKMLPIQETLDFLDRRINNAVALIGLPRIYAQKGTINKDHINDSEEVPIVEVSGTQPPTILDWTPINAQVVEWRGIRKAELYEISGGNSLQTNGQLPPGMQEASGKALDTFEDIYSARHAVKHRLLESFNIAVADLVIQVATEYSEGGGSYEVKLESGRKMRKISWKDVKMDREDFILKVFNISGLSRMPSTKFKQLERLLNAQVIDVPTFKRYWDMPDLESELELDTSSSTIVDEMLDDIAFYGHPRSPDEFSDFDHCIKRGTQYYNMLRGQDGFPPERLVMVADFIALATAMKTKRDQALAPPTPAPGAMPPMPPEGMPPPEALPPAPGGAPPALPPAPMAA